MSLSSPLVDLARAYERMLFGMGPAERLAHHLAHTTPENFLQLEMGYLVNRRGEDFRMDGWEAAVEKYDIDLILIPPRMTLTRELPPHLLRLEFKVVDSSDWGNWAPVYDDLGYYHPGRNPRKKPAGHYSVCLLSHRISQPAHKQRASTAQERAERFASVPEADKAFSPLKDFPLLSVSDRSAIHTVTWPRAIRGAWPSGFSAEARLVWVTLEK